MPDARRSGPRLANDPDRYLRRRGRAAWSVVAPCPRTGLRAYVGSFPTDGEARRARDEFLAGRRAAHPRGVKRVWTRGGALYYWVRDRRRAAVPHFETIEAAVRARRPGRRQPLGLAGREGGVEVD